jgi:dihydroneopterin aldolase
MSGSLYRMESSMRDVISLRGLEVFAHHGVFDHERAEGQTFVVDVEVEYDASAPSQSDEVADTLDYGVLASRIHEAVAGNPVNLLETLCQRVISTVLEFHQALATTVTIHKPHAPMEVSVADASVTMRRERGA